VMATCPRQGCNVLDSVPSWFEADRKDRGNPFLRPLMEPTSNVA
jgi:hypothetical protein